MRWIDRLSKAQRIAVVVALGLVLAALASYLVTLGSPSQRFTAGAQGFTAGGGFSVTFGGPLQPGLKPWLRLIIWLTLIGVWALASVRVLRPSPEKTEPR
jgi:hypothetical protein